MWCIDPGARIWRVPALLQNYFRGLRLHHQNALSRVNEIVVDNMEGEDMEGGEEDLGNPRRSSSSSTAATPSCLTTAVDAINSVGDIYNINAQRLPTEYDSANVSYHSGPNILVPFSGGVDSMTFFIICARRVGFHQGEFSLFSSTGSTWRRSTENKRHAQNYFRHCPLACKLLFASTCFLGLV